LGIIINSTFSLSNFGDTQTDPPAKKKYSTANYEKKSAPIVFQYTLPSTTKASFRGKIKKANSSYIKKKRIFR
jgi:hypothetical protein